MRQTETDRWRFARPRNAASPKVTKKTQPRGRPEGGQRTRPPQSLRELTCPHLRNKPEASTQDRSPNRSALKGLRLCVTQLKFERKSDTFQACAREQIAEGLVFRLDQIADYASRHTQ